MSEWRRVALKEVPSCKDVIETAASPDAMWSVLWDEFEGIFRCEDEEIKARQIYNFALWCDSNCKPRFLNEAVWLFFHGAVGAYIVGNEAMRNSLPKWIWMSSNQFNRWADAIGLPAERASEARKSFLAKQHESK